jgi:hypothetical protein
MCRSEGRIGSTQGASLASAFARSFIGSHPFCGVACSTLGCGDSVSARYKGIGSEEFWISATHRILARLGRYHGRCLSRRTRL